MSYVHNFPSNKLQYCLAYTYTQYRFDFEAGLAIRKSFSTDYEKKMGRDVRENTILNNASKYVHVTLCLMPCALETGVNEKE